MKPNNRSQRELYLQFCLSFLLLSGLTLDLWAKERLDRPDRPLPEFTQQAPDAWLNSSPLTSRELRGRVLLLDFWTFDCWNCYRSFPWLLALEEKLAEADFSVIGIHTPEFAHERKRASLEDKVKRFGLEHPIMMDNDFAFWNAMGTRYWPSFYLVDKQGMVRALFIGEVHQGDSQATAIERQIGELLAE